MADAKPDRLRTRKEFARARRYRRELRDAGPLEVVLIPAPEKRHANHCIRVVQNQNPPWFRRFAAKYQNCRGRMVKPRTFIVRSSIVKTLDRLINNRQKGTPNEARLLAFIRAEIADETPVEISPGYYREFPF